MAFTLGLGLESAAHGVRCNVVCPGSTGTPMPAAMGPAAASGAVAGDAAVFRAGIPLGAAPVADQGYVAAVARLVRRLRAGAAEKVVPARNVDLGGPLAGGGSDVAVRLMERYPSAYVFRVEWPSPAGRRRRAAVSVLSCARP